MTKTMRIAYAVALMVFVVSQVFASGLLVTCDVGGAKIERWNDDTHKYVSAGTFPKLFNVQQYEYVLI